MEPRVGGLPTRVHRPVGERGLTVLVMAAVSDGGVGLMATMGGTAHGSRAHRGPEQAPGANTARAFSLRLCVGRRRQASQGFPGDSAESRGKPGVDEGHMGSENSQRIVSSGKSRGAQFGKANSGAWVLR